MFSQKSVRRFVGDSSAFVMGAMFLASALKRGISLYSLTAYSKSTLNSFRFGLNRHYLSTRDINIINDPAFNETNKVFGAKCVELKRQGLAKVEHKQPICQEDLQKLY